MEELYKRSGKRNLRCGYTTGSCAAAAAKAAALMLLSGRSISEIPLPVPKGVTLQLKIEDVRRSDQGRSVSCAVRKDAGDDPDATNGLLVYARVSEIGREGSLCRPEHTNYIISSGETPSGETPSGETLSGETLSGETPSGETLFGETPSGETLSGETLSGETLSGEMPSGETPSAASVSGDGCGTAPACGGWSESYGDGLRLFLSGGEGVGEVTRPGLKQEIGQAAINPVPRQMIFGAVREICEDYDYHGCLSICISVPGGREAAGKTFNPRLGIFGGISILGTSGIVEPMSEKALLESVCLEMSVLAKEGHRFLLLTPGNYGETFAGRDLNMNKVQAVLCSNYIGSSLDMAAELGIEGVLFVSHIGKFIKLAGGIMNTHSRSSDSRAELCAAFALRAGISAKEALRILDTVTTDEAVKITASALRPSPALLFR